MKRFKNLPVIVVAILLAACLLAYYFGWDSSKPATPPKSAATKPSTVDTSLLRTALRLSPLAATPDEQGQAREAWRLADHEVDLAFASAMRVASADAVLPPAGPLRQLSDRITALNARVDADKTRVDQLTKANSDDLELAQAQLTLDQDELDDAQQELDREGGNRRASLQRLLQEHEASDKVADQGIKFGNLAPTGTMSEELQVWFSLNRYNKQLDAAAREAAESARKLLGEHDQLESQLPSQPDASASVARLRQLSGQRKTLANLDQRIHNTRQLSTVYQRWSAAVSTRQRGVLHLLLGSLAWILVILLAAILAHHAIPRVFLHTDPRRRRQLRMIARIALQLCAVLLILLVLFGAPTQLSTIIGLVTAGLTVVMKDFIVAFLGWFTLMGKNGISVGDWVEIEGVSGEVVEIGLLKTVLLELGNWTDSGRPTGRRVAFSNSFAMEQHYFNFTTASQWLWDEIAVILPLEGDPYEKARQIKETVERLTQADAVEAAKEPRRVAHEDGGHEISTTPAIDLRPHVDGFQLVVHYITRAPQRNAVKTKIFHAIIDLLHKPAGSEQGTAGQIA